MFSLFVYFRLIGQERDIVSLIFLFWVIIASFTKGHVFACVHVGMHAHVCVCVNVSSEHLSSWGFVTAVPSQEVKDGGPRPKAMS